MNEKAKNARNAYKRAWAKKNPDKVKASQARYWERRADDESSGQSIATADEQHERAEEMRTQGRKGCKAPRINVAFTPSNYRFVKIMSRATGNSMCEFINLVLKAYQDDHPELLQPALDLIESLCGSIECNKEEA